MNIILKKDGKIYKLHKVKDNENQTLSNCNQHFESIDMFTEIWLVRTKVRKVDLGDFDCMMST